MRKQATAAEAEEQSPGDDSEASVGRAAPAAATERLSEPEAQRTSGIGECELRMQWKVPKARFANGARELCYDPAARGPSRERSVSRDLSSAPGASA